MISRDLKKFRCNLLKLREKHNLPFIRIYKKLKGNSPSVKVTSLNHEFHRYPRFLTGKDYYDFIYYRLGINLFIDV